MGLDNGIILRTKVDVAIPEDIFICKYEVTHEGNDFDVRLNDIPKHTPVEVCYWRRCYALRNEINNVLNTPYEGGYAIIDNESLDKIINIIKDYTNKEYYDCTARGSGYGGMCWEYEDMIYTLYMQVRVLEWCQTLMDNHWVEELKFYDSY